MGCIYQPGLILITFCQRILKQQQVSVTLQLPVLPWYWLLFVVLKDSELPNVVPESPVEQIVEFSIDLVDPGYRELLDDPDSPQYIDLAHHLQDQVGLPASCFFYFCLCSVVGHVLFRVHRFYLEVTYTNSYSNYIHTHMWCLMG